MPYRFHDELSTADVAFEAWGATQEELFISSAAALLRTMADAPERVARRQELTILLEHEDLDLLLWSFLQELIFYKDARRLLLHADRVRIVEREGVFRLEAIVSGEQIETGRHRLLVDVKAVTLHRLQVEFKDNLWKAVISAGCIEHHHRLFKGTNHANHTYWNSAVFFNWERITCFGSGSRVRVE